MRRLLGACLALLACAAHAAEAPKPAYVLQPDRVWTGEGAAHAGWVVVVRDGAIVSVGPESAAIPADAQRIALPADGELRLPAHRV